MQYIKFTDSITDAWYMRSVFVGNSDSVASYKHWIGNHTSDILDGRKVRGSDIRYITDIKFLFCI